MRVSIIIATWNRARLLDQALAQFRAVRIPSGGSWELIVVNNNCTDDTDQVAAKYAGELPVVLCHESAPGKVHALNHALGRATGDYVLFTDDDALVEPDWVEQVLTGFERFEADLVFGRVLPWWETAPPAWFAGSHDGNFALLDYGPEAQVITDAGLAPYGVNYAFRKCVFDRLGGFRVGLGPNGTKGYGGEDDEIFRRVLANGMTVAYFPLSAVRHFIPAARCEKAYHRRRVWYGSRDHITLLRWEAASGPPGPHIGGVPRHVFRRYLGYLPAYIRSLVARDPVRTFHHELRLIHLAGIIWWLTTRAVKPLAVDRTSGRRDRT